MKFDTSLGICPRALAVLQIVSLEEFGQKHLCDIQPRAWYNGRENGICIEVNKNLGNRSVFISISNHRHVDEAIRVFHWTGRATMNGPSGIESVADGEVHDFSFRSVDEAVQYIADSIRTVLQSGVPAPKKEALNA